MQPLLEHRSDKLPEKPGRYKFIAGLFLLHAPDEASTICAVELPRRMACEDVRFTAER